MKYPHESILIANELTCFLNKHKTHIMKKENQLLTLSLKKRLNIYRKGDKYGIPFTFSKTCMTENVNF